MVFVEMIEEIHRVKKLIRLILNFHRRGEAEVEILDGENF